MKKIDLRNSLHPSLREGLVKALIDPVVDELYSVLLETGRIYSKCDRDMLVRNTEVYVELGGLVS